MKCPNCGASIGKDTKFCPNCGSSIEFTKPDAYSKKSNNSEMISNVFDTISSKPILIGIVVVVIIVILASMAMTGNNSSNQNFSDDGGSIIKVYGVSFHIPNGFKESYHSGPSSSGETVDFQSEDYDDLEIEVAPQRNVNLNSNHVKVKMQKTIGGKEGTLVYYDSNRVSFFYNEKGYTIKLNTNSPDHDELFTSVIV